jgi:predicted alpha-1,6-mannanase (GH76 family)
MYLQAAQQSAEFIRAHLVNNQNIAQDGMSGRASDSCLVSSIIEPYNSGLMMEGLATIASINQDASTRNLRVI